MEHLQVIGGFSGEAVANATRAGMWADEAGVTAIEYGLIASLIAVVCIGALTNTSVSLSAIYTAWSTAVLNALQGAL